MYKPGQLVTKPIRGVNHVLRIAKCDPWNYPCDKCIVDAMDSCPRVKRREICDWCIINLNTNMYLKKA